MSAFDIAGAVVWTPLALSWWYDIITDRPDWIAHDDYALGTIIAVVLTLAATYCIARLFGAQRR